MLCICSFLDLLFGAWFCCLFSLSFHLLLDRILIIQGGNVQLFRISLRRHGMGDLVIIFIPTWSQLWDLLPTGVKVAQRSRASSLTVHGGCFELWQPLLHASERDGPRGRIQQVASLGLRRWF